MLLDLPLTDEVVDALAERLQCFELELPPKIKATIKIPEEALHRHRSGTVVVKVKFRYGRKGHANTRTIDRSATGCIACAGDDH